jgi:streptogramin lyase
VRNDIRTRRHSTIKLAGALFAVALCLGTASPALAASPAASSSTLTESVSSVPNGADITFSYSTPAATVNSTNWIGIYSPGQTPGQVGSTTYQYAPGSSGTVTFATTNLNGVGPYAAFYLYDNGYQVLAGPVDFSVVASQPAPAPLYQRAFGGHGPGALTDPFGVAVDGHGNVWVADRASSTVEEFTPSGTLATAFGNSGPGALHHPDGIAVGPDGDIWVSDTGSDRIVEFSPGGRELQAFGSAGTGNGQLDRPQDLVVAPGGDVYVADQGNNRIEEFSPAGGYLSSISVATPYGVALDASGDLWVSSPSYADGNAVYEFSAAGSQLEDYNSTQAEYGALSNPGGIAVGPGGRIYVAQPDYGWVTVYNPDGSFYTEFGLQADTGRASEDLAFPQDLAITPGGRCLLPTAATAGSSSSPGRPRRAQPRRSCRRPGRRRRAGRQRRAGRLPRRSGGHCSRRASAAWPCCSSAAGGGTGAGKPFCPLGRVAPRPACPRRGRQPPHPRAPRCPRLRPRAARPGWWSLAAGSLPAPRR